jgi:WD40 repeat protein
LSLLGETLFCGLDVDSGKSVHQFEIPPNQCPRLAASGEKLVWIDPYNSTIHTRDVFTGEEFHHLAVSDRHAQSADFTDDARKLFTVSGSGRVIDLWDVPTGARIQRLRPRLPTTESFTIRFSADAKVLLVWPRNGPFHCWDVPAGRELRPLDNPLPGRTSVVALSPNGRIAAAGYWDGTIRWWETATGKQTCHVHAHPNRVSVLTFSRDGKVLASHEESDGAIQLWDVATGDKLSSREGHQAGVAALSIAPDGRTVATAGEDHTVRLWSTTTGEELRRFRTDGWAVAFSPNGTAMAISGDGENDHRPGTVWLLDPATGKKLRMSLGVHVFPFRTFAFSPDGSKLYGGGQENCLWEVATGKVMREYPCEDMQPRPAAFSPDGTILAVGRAATIELQDLNRDQVFRCLGPTHKPNDNSNRFFSLAFAPDGRLLAAAIEAEWDRMRGISPRDGVIRIYDVATGDERMVLKRHRKLVTSVQFSPDGKTLVSGGEDGTVRLWDLASGKELRRFEGHRDKVTCVAFAPDGRTVISGSGDSTALVWDVEHSGQH